MMDAGQRIKLDPRHRGILVILVEDTHLRIPHGDEEIAVRPRRDLTSITRLHVTGGGVKPRPGQTAPGDIRLRTS